MNNLLTGPLAIISDIHGNLDALAAVLKDVAAHCCRGMVCLGDIVGYGPEPGACVRLVREYANTTIAGNHEMMFLNLNRIKRPAHWGAADDLWRSLDLCHDELSPDDVKWIRQLPHSVVIGDASFVHGSMHQPHGFDYVTDIKFARRNFFAQETPVSFHGHTHVPAIWEKKGREITSFTPHESPVTLAPPSRYAVCVGSVGQPRDEDPRAAYALYDPEGRRLTIRRLKYDINRAYGRFEDKKLLGFHAHRIFAGG